MNCSQLLPIVNRGRWKHLQSLLSTQQKTVLPLFTVPQNGKMGPVFHVSAGRHSQWTGCFSALTEQCVRQRQFLHRGVAGLTKWLSFPQPSVPSVGFVPGGGRPGEKCVWRCCHTWEGGDPQQGQVSTALEQDVGDGNLKTALDSQPEGVGPKSYNETQAVRLGKCEDSEDDHDNKYNDENDDHDVKRLTQEVVRRAGQRDVMILSVPERQVEQLIDGLLQCGWQPPHILSLLSTHPSLLHHHHHRRALLPFIHLLLTLGFDPTQVKVIVEQLPGVILTSKSQICQTMDTLQGLGFGGHTVFTVVSHNPSLLTTSKTALSERVASLRELFKSADVVTLGVRCPQVLSDPWGEVKAKFDYVFHEMGVTQKQMVRASLFSHSLSHVRKRHTFLVRAGLFSTAKRKEGERSSNATLDQIIATSDKAFCRKFGGFHVAEYRAFCLLFDKEQALLRDSDSEDDEELET